MITTVYQLVNNMEANYAGKVAIQYYDEAKGGVVSIRYGQYAQDIRRAAGLLLHRDPDIRARRSACWPATATIFWSICSRSF